MPKRRRRPNATGRDEGERYMLLPFPMIQSAAWRSLSGPAVKVWIELRARYNGSNNGRLTLSLDEAARLLGLSKTTVARAFADLQAKAFVTMIRRGHWYGRQASQWSVTDCALGGNLPTRAWKQWRPEQADASSVPRRNIKTENGTEAVPSASATVSVKYRSTKVCTATEPVSPIFECAIGTVADR